MLYTIKEIDAAADYILEQAGTARVLAFGSGMGSGKTTLINAICKALNVADIPSSPTFSIINEYATLNGEKIYHLDLYRLKDLEEVLQAGVEEVLYSGHYCFVEWPQMATAILPEDTVFVRIEHVSEDTRELFLEK